MKIQARETYADGMCFRSRLEAAWYLYLRRFGFTPIYEPELLEVMDAYGESMGNWLPDFYLPEVDSYVEIKPLIDEFDAHDQRSMVLAYVAGYTKQAIIVLGPPQFYFAVACNERRKGNPSGEVVEFWNSSDPALYIRSPWGSDCYPDESDRDWTDPRVNCVVGGCEIPVEGRSDYAATAWNATQWHPC